ncbi:hypothetical protein MBLNU230_g0150t1 [Neophaeotheca triangularis]
MALRRCQHDNPFLLPPHRSTDVFYPSIYRDHRAYPYEPYERRLTRRRDRRGREEEGESPAERNFSYIREGEEKHAGDLGWSLEFATAWCYRHLLGNQSEVADMIDTARQIVGDEVRGREPEMIFDGLDKALFGGKLEGMVRLRWKLIASSTPGITSVPGVNGPRICIQLNKAPFEDGVGDVEELLDAMIHQMIHAFFLVCCGAQPKDAKQDGRLLDGLHFGVILLTIKDISRRCKLGALPLVFYSRNRRNVERQRNLQARLNGAPRRDLTPSFVALDTKSTAIGPPPADGQSHCSHENASITRAQIKNWQVQSYSVAIDLAMDDRGDEINDLGADKKLHPIKRVNGPPSDDYIEAIWGGSRIMFLRKKAMQFPSLKKAIEKDRKKELKIPDCSMDLLCCLWDYISHQHYFDPDKPSMKEVDQTDLGRLPGPPTIRPIREDSAWRDSRQRRDEYEDDPKTHIEVYKLAEDLKFDELQGYALYRLYKMHQTSKNPIEALKELYKSKPIASDLHKWARKFLAKGFPKDQYGRPFRGAGMNKCNLNTLQECYRSEFEDLFNKCEAFKDDCVHVRNELLVGAAGLDRNQEYVQGFPPQPAAQFDHWCWDPYDRDMTPPPMPANYLTAPRCLDDAYEPSTPPPHRRRARDSSGSLDDDPLLLTPVRGRRSDNWITYLGSDGRWKARNEQTHRVVYI